MKKFLSCILLLALGLSVWGQANIQVQTKTEQYDLSDAYSITFEDSGRVQVIKTRYHGDVRIPMTDLIQIHFNDTAVSLADQIKNLENCEIMKTLLLEGVPGLSPDFFWQYLNSPSVTKVFIPTDDAFLTIPSFSLAPRSEELLSITLNKEKSFPFTMKSIFYNPLTGEKKRDWSSSYSQDVIIETLKRLVLNQFVVGTDNVTYTATGSEIEYKDGQYEGTYQKTAALSGWQNFPKINVLQEFGGADGKTYLVTDECVHETTSLTYEALSEIAPRFLSLMDVPVQLLIDCGYVAEEDAASVTFFKTQIGRKIFNWTSSQVNYTIFAPSDEAIDEVVNSGEICTWEMIEAYKNEFQGNANTDIWLHEQIAKVMSFIKRHICFGNVMIGVSHGRSEYSEYATCDLSSDGVARFIGVKKNSSTEQLEISNERTTAKTVSGMVRYVRDPISLRMIDSYDVIFSTLDAGNGMVMQIDKAMMVYDY